MENKSNENLCNICNKKYVNKKILCQHNKKYHPIKKENVLFEKCPVLFEKSNENLCNICNKKYVNEKTLCQHNNKYHPIIIDKIPSKKSPVLVIKGNGNLCNICNKSYSTYNSLWKHNNKYHPINKNKMPENIIVPLINNTNCKMAYECDYCKKCFNTRQNKWDHQKNRCKNKNIEDNIKSDTINNGIVNNITNVNNINNINNIINVNINISNNKVSFCNEDLSSLTRKDKKNILDAGFLSLVKLIEIIHLNKNYPHYQNIKIYNLKDKFAKTYDKLTDTFTTINKKESIDSLICTRLYDLKTIHKEFGNKDNMFHRCALELINKVESCASDTNNKKLAIFYKDLQDELILLIYNKTKLFD
jgi:hypothetical protein